MRHEFDDHVDRLLPFLHSLWLDVQLDVESEVAVRHGLSFMDSEGGEKGAPNAVREKSRRADALVDVPGAML
jgi:hypothetical protein